ncbi:MAG TPA: hypothetical protein VKJ45_27480 [Blastocatellia bacterium]|nr:hypothetical protein [Blastocatellia bacterium]
MPDWIDEEFEKLRQKRDQAQQRNEAFSRLARQKWRSIVDAVERDAAKLDSKLAELEPGQSVKVITVTTDGDVIIVEKQSQPSYRVSLRLEVLAKAIRLDRQVVIGPGNAKREVSERLVLELYGSGDDVSIEHPEQGQITVDDVSKYALLPIVRTLEKVLSRQ